MKRLAHALFYFCVLVSSTGAKASAQEHREWTSADGTKKFSGELEWYDPPTVTVLVPQPGNKRNSEPKRLKFPDSKLSEADRRYLKTVARVLSETGGVTRPFTKGKAKYVPITRYEVFENIGGEGYLVMASDRVCFIHSHPTIEVAEGDDTKRKLYRTGTFEYVQAGQFKSVNSYAVTLDQAVKIWDRKLNSPRHNPNRRRGQ